MESSDLDMVVARTESAVLMVESEANELTEDQMLGAVLFAHQEMQVVISAIKEFKNAVEIKIGHGKNLKLIILFKNP